jgi:hypothetical protein
MDEARLFMAMDQALLWFCEAGQWFEETGNPGYERVGHQWRQRYEQIRARLTEEQRLRFDTRASRTKGGPDQWEQLPNGDEWILREDGD